MGEAIRRKVLLVILLIGAVCLILGPSLGILSARSETTVLKGMMLGVIQLTSAVIAIVLTVYMIPNEIERRTIYTILSKPVQRWQFLVGKYLGAVAALGLMMALMAFLMLLMFFFQQGMRNPADLSELLKAPLMYFVQMSILAAVAVSLSTFVTPLVNFFLTGAIYLAGSLFNPFLDTIRTNANTPGPAKAFATVVNAILPNFANYNIQNPIINPGQEIHNEGSYYLMASVYGVFYILIALIVGILIFDRREV